MSFMKNDLKDGKPDWSLFPFDGAEGVVRILMMGAKKYARDNWRQGLDDPDAQRRIFSAIIRHLTALQRGETIDPESGEHHILHAATNCLFLAAFAETRRRMALRDLEQEARDMVEAAYPAAEAEPEVTTMSHTFDKAYCQWCGDPECNCCYCPECLGSHGDKAGLENDFGMPTETCNHETGYCRDSENLGCNEPTNCVYCGAEFGSLNGCLDCIDLKGGK